MKKILVRSAVAVAACAGILVPANAAVAAHNVGPGPSCFWPMGSAGRPAYGGVDFNAVTVGSDHPRDVLFATRATAAVTSSCTALSKKSEGRSPFYPAIRVQIRTVTLYESMGVGKIKVLARITPYKSGESLSEMTMGVRLTCGETVYPEMTDSIRYSDGTTNSGNWGQGPYVKHCK